MYDNFFFVTIVHDKSVLRHWHFPLTFKEIIEQPIFVDLLTNVS